MKHLYNDFKVDNQFELDLYSKWLLSELDIEYTEWLELMVYHRCSGGGSNKDIDILKKTIAVLVQELKK